MEKCMCGSRPTAHRSPPTLASQPFLQLGPSFLRLFRPPPSIARHVCMVSSNASAPTPKMAPAFHPTVWGDFFIKHTHPLQQKSDKWMEGRANQLKKEISALFEACKDVADKMNLVDVLQRLGIDHHFEDKIAIVLKNIHSVEFDSSSLHEVALRFRLLRQAGYWVSPDEFNKFKCEDGSFIIDVTNDPKGLLSLYNASYLLIQNEGALEEAIVFARHHLELVRSSLKSPLAEQVTRALQVPLPRTLKRLEALLYISEYNMQDQMYNPSILELAKLDFNILQHLHQKELKAVSQWWEDVSKDIRLDYIRDRVVEVYFCSYTVYYEQEQTRARMIFTKLLMLISMLDDTYDTGATLEEGRKLNEAIQIWDESAVSLLPEYQKNFFLKMISSFTEFEDELEPHEKFRNAYVKNAFQMLSGYYLQEAEWFHDNYIPSFKDQVDVSVMSACCQVLSVGVLVGMGDVATKEAFEWAFGCTGAIKAIGEVTRFVDDMAGFKQGRDKMDVASSVECYIKEHNVTSEVALEKIESLVEEAWKTINQARFEHHALLPVVQRLASLTMSMAFFCHDKKDVYKHSKDMKETVENHFVNPIPL